MVTSAAGKGSTDKRGEYGVVARAMTHVQQFFCGMHGHDSLLHFEQGRMSLQCTSCGYESPGWDLKTAAARPAAATPKPRLLRLPLVRERRAA